MDLLPGVKIVDTVGFRNRPPYSMNVLLVEGGPGDYMLLDTGTPGNASNILNFLKRENVEPGALKSIVITHVHADHCGSGKEIKSATNAKVMAHEVEIPFIEGEEVYPQKNGMEREVAFEPFSVEVGLKDGDWLDYLGGLQVIHTPGHTPGHIVLYSPSKRILFCADLLGNVEDKLKPPPDYYTLDIPELNRSIKQVAELDFDILIPYHGLPIMSNGRDRVRKVASNL